MNPLDARLLSFGIHKRDKESLRRMLRGLHMLVECNQAIIRATDESALLKRICAILVHHAGYCRAWVGYPADAEKQTLRAVAHAGFEEGEAATINIACSDAEREESLTSSAIRRCEAVVRRYLAGAAHGSPCRQGPLKRTQGSLIALPLVSGSVVFGVLTVCSPAADAFDGEEEGLLAELAKDLSCGIGAIRLRAFLGRQEQEARAGDALLPAILDHVGLGIAAMNPKMEIIWMNQRMRQWFPHVDATQHPVCAGTFDHAPRSASCPGCPARDTLKDGCVRQAIIEILGKKGPREFRATASPLRTAGGAISGVVETLEEVTDIRLAEKEHHAHTKKLKEALEGSVRFICSAFEVRDPYTAGHQRRVADLAGAIAEDLGLPENQVQGIRIAGYVHDIGKLAVPAEVLAKPGELTDLERVMIRNHPRTGYEILKEIDFSWPVADITLQHHERNNGSGYPNGLRDNEIRLGSKIICVADVVEAMSSHRPYHPALGIDAALQEIAGKRGVLYEPAVADACERLFAGKRFQFVHDAPKRSQTAPQKRWSN